ncbi:unnamed protein product [Ectocarpus sp. CCAP 1310/34]|nr:unnamed protein product [Ectocarpus sp. CCAP 1310/34]
MMLSHPVFPCSLFPAGGGCLVGGNPARNPPAL